MTKSIEITKQERARLGRDTMLQWAVKENKAKLKALRKEISEYLKTGKTTELEKLRQTIIRNTRKDLDKIKDLTDAERDKKAKEFADKVIRYVKENKDLNDVFFTSRVELGPEKAEKFKNNKEELLKQWIENNPKGDVEIIQDDPKYLALKNISDNKTRSSAFILLGLIEKFHGGRDVAMKLYKKGLKGNKFDLDVLRARFTKEKAKSTVGFYYGTRKIMWNFGKWTTDERQRKRIENAGFKCDHVKDPHSGTTDAYLVYVTGWWAWDQGEDNKNYFNNDEYTVEKGFLKKLRSGGGYGDEWMGKDIQTALTDKRNNLLKELKSAADENLPAGARDSGLTRDREGEVRQALLDLMKIPENVYKSKSSNTVLLWFKRNANKWVTLEKNKDESKNIHGLMQYLYGLGVGLFKYRYVPTQKKIYFIRIADAQLEKLWGKGGYIDIKDGKMVRKWNSYSLEKSKQIFRKEIIDNMTEAEINKEISFNKVRLSEGTRKEKLKITEGYLYKIRSHLPKNVEYNKLKESYIDKIQIKLKKYLLKRGYKGKEDLADDLATIRAEDIHEKIMRSIKDDDVLSKAIEDNEKEKLRISIDSSDVVEVKLFDINKAKKLKNWFKDKAESLKTTAKDISESTMDRLEKKLEKYFGPLAPVAMWVLDKFFKIKDAFVKMAKGGTSLVGGLVTSILGIKVSKDILKSKKITDEVIEKLPPKKKKYYKFKKQMYFSEDVDLKGKKIVIPKGKGIKPGKKFEVKITGIRDKVAVLPIKEKKGSLWGIFGRRKEEYRLKEREIIITDGTTIPEGTVIPKGAKIYKV